jgi:hypothetical protein
MATPEKLESNLTKVAITFHPEVRWTGLVSFEPAADDSKKYPNSGRSKAVPSENRRT